VFDRSGHKDGTFLKFYYKLYVKKGGLKA